MNERQRALRGTLCTIVGGICWGVSGACGQYLFDSCGIQPVWLVCVRMLCGGLVLTLAALPKHGKNLLELIHQPKELLKLVCFGLFGLLLCQFSYLTAIGYTNAGTTTVLQNLNLVFIMLITCVHGRKRPDRVQLIALILALSGTYILATGGDPRHMSISPQGFFWGLLTAAAVTVYTLLPRQLVLRWGKEPVTGVGMLIGGIFINAASRGLAIPVHLSGMGWAAVVGAVILGSIVAFPLFMQGIADVGPVKSSMLAATEPVSATVCSALFLHTAFSLTDMIGFIMILITIFLLAREPAPADGASLEEHTVSKVEN